MIVPAKCKLNNAELFLLKLFYIQSKEIGNKKYNEETRELDGKVRFRLNIDLRKEKEDS